MVDHSCQQREYAADASSKCDEERPVCGACSARWRICKYSYPPEASNFVYECGRDGSAKAGKVSLAGPQDGTVSHTLHSSPGSPAAETQPSTLRLQYVQRIGGASGLLMTFKQHTYRQRKPSAPCVKRESAMSNEQTPHLIPALLSPVTRLSNRYGAIFGCDGLRLNPLGPWIRYAWINAGDEPCLEHALDYVYESMVGFQRRDDTKTTIRIHTAGERALRSLRAATNTTTESEKLWDSLLIAIMLHYAAEVSQLPSLSECQLILAFSILSG